MFRDFPKKGKAGSKVDKANFEACKSCEGKDDSIYFSPIDCEDTLRIYFPKLDVERNKTEGVSLRCESLEAQQHAIELQMKEKKYMTNWLRGPAGEPLDADGYWGRPGNKKYFKLPLPAYWIDESSAKLLLRSKGPISFIAKVKTPFQRIGNRIGHYGQSDQHGQLPGEVIYVLRPMDPKTMGVFLRDVKRSKRAVKVLSQLKPGLIPAQTRVHAPRKVKRFLRENPMLAQAHLNLYLTRRGLLPKVRHRKKRDERIIYPRTHYPRAVRRRESRRLSRSSSRSSYGGSTIAPPFSVADLDEIRMPIGDWEDLLSNMEVGEPTGGGGDAVDDYWANLGFE